MHLLVEFFEAACRKRSAEFLWCLYENLKCEQIEIVHLFKDPATSLPFDSPKIEVVDSESRVTYLRMFEYCNQELENEICIVANGDIIFTESLDRLRGIDIDPFFITLSRWEMDREAGGNQCYLFDNPASQDSWIFKAPIQTSNAMDFHMGVPGCDNRIARIMHDQGLNVINPSKSIRTIHFHHSQIRTYTHRDLVEGPYLIVEPSEIEAVLGETSSRFR